MIKNKISILVVDDEIDICEMVAETLRDENYNAISRDVVNLGILNRKDGSSSNNE